MYIETNFFLRLVVGHFLEGPRYSVVTTAQTLSLKNTSTFSIDNTEADVVLEQSLFMLGQTLEWDMRWQ